MTRMLEFVCLFVYSITQKQMIPKCSNLVDPIIYAMSLGYHDFWFFRVTCYLLVSTVIKDAGRNQGLVLIVIVVTVRLLWSWAKDRRFVLWCTLEACRPVLTGLARTTLLNSSCSRALTVQLFALNYIHHTACSCSAWLMTEHMLYVIVVIFGVAMKRKGYRYAVHISPCGDVWYVAWWQIAAISMSAEGRCHQTRRYTVQSMYIHVYTTFINGIHFCHVWNTTLLLLIVELHWTVLQGRNFGLKSGGTNSERERGTLGSPRRKGRRMRRKHPLLIRFWGLRECCELSQRAWLKMVLL